MFLTWITCQVLLLTSPFEVGIAQRASAPLNILVETERAFAVMSERDGMKKAFLTYLSDDGVVFQPAPQNGKSMWRTRAETTARLAWYPVVVCVAASGDLGYTSGPWVYTPEAHLDQPPRYGQYVSVWKKQRNGTWKVAADIGITHEYSPGTDSLVVVSSTIPPKRKGSRLREREILLAAEHELSALASSEDVAAALARFLAEDGRVYRDEMTPFVGRKHVLEGLRSVEAKVSYRVLYASLSRAYDLAYTYGSYFLVDQRRAEGFFLRVWRRNELGHWNVVVDVNKEAD